MEKPVILDLGGSFLKEGHHDESQQDNEYEHENDDRSAFVLVRFMV